jgi:hypothetical protein
MGKGFNKEWVDPIDIFIDKQLATPWREHQLYTEVIHSMKSWEWCPGGRAPLYISPTFSIVNTIEDDLINAIDKKYKGVNSRLDKEIELLLEGYRLNEIAWKLGVNRRTVWLDIKAWREDHDDEDEETIRRLSAYIDS